MGMKPTFRSSGLARAGQSALLLATAACAQPAATAVAIPRCPEARLGYGFTGTTSRMRGKGIPAVGINGGIVGEAQLGGAFYRDVPAGHYAVTVETTGADFSQVANLEVAPAKRLMSRSSRIRNG